MPDSAPVRVKDNATGHEYTIPTSIFEANKSGLSKLDKPAVGPDGQPLPPKYKTSVSAEAAKSKPTGQSADSKKEDS